MGQKGRRRSAASRKTSPRRRAGEIDPIVGRDEEIRQIVDILMRRRQNNPILTGEAGVGKTAVVEGFALRIADRRRAAAAKRCEPVRARCGSVAGRREHEGRVRAASALGDRRSAELADAHHPVHRRGPYPDRRRRAAGTGDAANLLKPALARGTLRTIAATTWAEYRIYREGSGADAPLPGDADRRARRAAVLRMMRGILGPMEKHHQVRSPMRHRSRREPFASLYSGAPIAG